MQLKLPLLMFIYVEHRVAYRLVHLITQRIELLFVYFHYFQVTRTTREQEATPLEES